MTANPRSPGRITKRRSRPDPVRTRPAETPLLRHERELWGLTALPDEIAVSHYGPTTRAVIDSILVPLAGGPNSSAAVRVATELARDWDATIALLTVVGAERDAARRQTAKARLEEHADDITAVPTTIEISSSDAVVGTLAAQSQEHELIVMGDSDRTLFQRLFTGTVPRRLNDRTDIPILVAERVE